MSKEQFDISDYLRRAHQQIADGRSVEDTELDSKILGSK